MYFYEADLKAVRNKRQELSKLICEVVSSVVSSRMRQSFREKFTSQAQSLRKYLSCLISLCLVKKILVVCGGRENLAKID